MIFALALALVAAPIQQGHDQHAKKDTAKVHADAKKDAKPHADSAKGGKHDEKHPEKHDAKKPH